MKSAMPVKEAEIKQFSCFFSTGKAKLRVSLRDRRNSSDVFSMPGDFTTVDQSGSVQPLKTYGILQVKVQDENNQKLDLAGNMKIYLDADKVEHRFNERV